MVIRHDEDLGSIGKSYPYVYKHKDYHSSAEFPDDISDQLTDRDRWWEHLDTLQLLRLTRSPAYKLKSQGCS
jgi:hypothetical protein